MSTRHLIVPLSLAAFAAPGFAALGPEARPKVIYTPIVLTGQSAPGGGTFSMFPYHSVINDADQVLFLGSTNISSDSLYITSPSGMSRVVRAGQVATGYAPGVTIGGLDINYHQANNLGQAVFESTLYGPGMDPVGADNTNAYGNWFWSAGQLTPIAQNGTHAAGTPAGVNYRALDRTTLNDLGQVAFHADLSGASVNDGNNTAFFFGAPGNLQLLAREGSAGPDGITYGEMSGFDYPVLSASGKIVFLTSVAGGNVFDNRAIVAGTLGDLHVVAQSGQAAPGTATTFHDIHAGWNTPRVNNKGEVLFASTLNDGTRGIWEGKAGSLTLIGQTGQPAPGLGGAKYDFFFDLALNDKGQVAYRADFASGDDSAFAIYAGNPHNPTLIAAAGQHAPGTEDGVEFGYLTDPVLNKDGQVAFFGYLTGENSRGPNDYGIFATGHNGDLRLIARYGDDFQVGPGDIRNIVALSHAGVFGTHILSFNADSNLVFMAKFADGSEGIFTATVLPEPAEILSFLSVSTLLVFRRRGSMKCG
jgi:hypothetical protein